MKTRRYKGFLIIDTRKENCEHNWAVLINLKAEYFYSLVAAKTRINEVV